MNRKKISLLLALTMLVCSLLGGCSVKSEEESDLENGAPEKEGYVLDFSGWDEPENKYPIEWLIDYVRVYKDINGYE